MLTDTKIVRYVLVLVSVKGSPWHNVSEKNKNVMYLLKGSQNCCNDYNLKIYKSLLELSYELYIRKKNC